MSRQPNAPNKETPNLPALFNLFTAERAQGSPEILRILAEAREIAENPKQKANKLCRLVAELSRVRHLSYKTWLEFAETLQLPTEKIKNDLDIADTDDAMKKNESLMRNYVNQMCMATNAWDDLIRTAATIRKQHNFKDQVPYMMWLLKYGELDNVDSHLRQMINYVYVCVIASNDKDTFEKLMQPPYKIYARLALRLIGLANHTGFIELIKKYDGLVADDKYFPLAWEDLLGSARSVRAHDVIVEMNKHYPTTGIAVTRGINKIYRDVFSHSYKYIPPKYTSFEQLIKNAPKSIPHSELYSNIKLPADFYQDLDVLEEPALGYATANQMLDLVRGLFVQKMKTVYLNNGVEVFNDFYKRYHYKDSRVWTRQEMPWAQKTILLQYEIEDIQEILGNTKEAHDIIIIRLKDLVSSVLVNAYTYKAHEPRTDWLGINETLQKGFDPIKIMPTPAELRTELLKYVSSDELGELRNSVADAVNRWPAYQETFAPNPPNASGAGSSTDPMVD